MRDTTADAPGFRNWFSFPAWGYTFLPIMLALRHINGPPDTRTYGPSHWFLDYHHGFVRRALVGQAFAHVAFLSWKKIFLIEAAVLLLAIALTYLAFRSLLFGSLDERRFTAFLLAAPAFLPHMSYMSGEMDNFLYIALILGASILMQFENAFGLMAATAFTLVGLAIHEGFLLMFYPLILALLVDLMHRKRLKVWWLGVHGAVVGAFFLLMLMFGKLHGAQAEWIAQAQQRTNMPIEGTVFMALQNTFAQQVHFAMGRYTHLLLRGIAITMVLCIPYGIALWRILRGTVTSRGYNAFWRGAVTLLFFLPLLLIPLGHDAMRWTSALCINMSMYALFLYQADGGDVSHPERGLESRLALARWNSNPASAATFLYLLALGPWGLAGNRFFSNLSNLFGKS